MANFRSILEISANEWLDAMGLTADEIPDAVIVEGSWWREQRQTWRLSYLTEVRELSFPDLFWGRYNDKKIAFCMAYGAPRTVEVIYLFGKIGTQLAIQIGTCGGLQSHLHSGDIILPEVAVGRDGVAHMFGDIESAMATPQWVGRAETLLQARNHTTHQGAHMTWSSLFTETVAMQDAWHRAGFLSVDMETATTFSVAQSLGMDALSMLVVWDDLTRGRRFLDPLSSQEQADLDRANGSIYETALVLVDQWL